jgi:hypothetical protein
MANEQSPVQTTLDSSQVPHNTHHQQVGVLKTMDGFLLGQVGRKIVMETMSTTVERYHFQQGSDVLFTYEITYTNAAHDGVSIAERIN